MEPKGSLLCSQVLPMFPILRHASTPHPHTFFKIHFNVILLSTYRSSKWSLPFRFSDQIFVCTSMHAACLTHLILLDLIILIIVVKGTNYGALCYVTFSIYLVFPLLGPNIPLSTLFLYSISLCSTLTMRDQVSCLYKTTSKIIGLCILIFRFQMGEWKIKFH